MGTYFVELEVGCNDLETEFMDSGVEFFDLGLISIDSKLCFHALKCELIGWERDVNDLKMGSNDSGVQVCAFRAGFIDFEVYVTGLEEVSICVGT